MGDEHATGKPASIKQSAAFAGGTFAVMGVADLVAHLGPTGLFVSGLASYVAWRHGPELFEQMRGILPSHLLEEWQADDQAAAQSGQERGRSLLDRALGRFPEHDEQQEQSETEHHDTSASQCAPQQQIVLARDLCIPLAGLAGKAIFIAGMRRSGKTTLGALLAEQLGRYYIPLFIPCFEGDYLSLAEVLPRGLVAGHPSATAQYHDTAFVPVTHATAAPLGYDLLELGYQVILDLASYPRLEEGIAAQIQVIRGMFAWAERHPEQRTTAYVYLDEAQRYLPENLRESVIDDKFVLEQLFKVYKDILAIGGKRGISPVILTQRFAQVNKKIMAQAEISFLMRQTSDTDLARCMEYVKQSTATPETIAAFRTGQGVYLAADGEQRVVQFDKRRSDDTRSRTPRPEIAQRYAQMPMRLSRPQHEEASFPPATHRHDEERTPLAQQPTPEQQPLPTPHEAAFPKAVLPEKGRKAEEIDLAKAIAIWNSMHPSIKDLEDIFGLTNHQARRLREMILQQAHPEQPEATQGSTSE